MIESQKHLLRLLRLDKVQLENLLSNLDFYYYQMKKVKKDKKGNIKRDAEGDPLYRVLYPSKGELKIIQL